MNIQGPTGPPPVDNNEPVSVTPSAASPAAKNTAQTPTASVQLQLSPTLFRPGQILDVVIAKIEQDALILVLQNKLMDNKGNPLNIQFRVPVFPGAQQGQQLSVQVTDIKNNLPVLQLLSVSKNNVDVLATLQQALSNNKPLQNVFEHLSAAKILPSDQLAIPNEIKNQIDRLWRSLPEATQVQRPDNLRHALSYAGPFLEAQLAKVAMGSERVFPAMDVRAQLLRLAEVLRQHVPQQQPTPTTPATASSRTAQTTTVTTTALPTATTAEKTVLPTTAQVQQAAQTSRPDPNVPSVPVRQTVQFEGLRLEQVLQQLLQQTDAGLSRIQQHQAQMAQPDARPQWTLELPLKTANGVDVFDIRIHPDAEQQGSNQQVQAYPWTVMLAFNLEGLGPVRAQVSLFNGKISTYWWAEQAHTVSLFQQHLGFLENRLQHAGVDFHQLVCEFGIPKTNTHQKQTPYSNTNLDERV